MNRSRRGRVVRMSIFVSAVAGCAAAAQVSTRDTAFIASAKRAAVKYRAQDAAIADGFRPVGVEFPAMGEHWVSLQRVMANTIDPLLPSVLIYVTVNGRPVLGGVGYTDLLRTGEPLPPAPAAGFWHEHNGSVADESFPLRHQMGQETNAATDDGLRLAILHLWTEIPNDAGPFATDNWRLPSRRLGHDGGRLGLGATRAVALAQDETGYYALMLRVALHPSDRDDGVIDRTVADARTAAMARLSMWRSAEKSGRPSTASAEASLAGAWDAMWRTLGERLPGHRDQLRVLRLQLEGASHGME
jgi:hypothetical protein